VVRHDDDPVLCGAIFNRQNSQVKARQIRARWEEFKKVTEGFVACREEDHFSHLRNHAAKHATAGQG
jgi:hypothetical protein